MNILAIGGGGFQLTERYGAKPGPLIEHALSLTGKEAPKVCALYTATGDDVARIANWYSAWADRPERASHVAVMPMPNVDDLRKHLLGQHAVYVGGGSVARIANWYSAWADRPEHASHVAVMPMPNVDDLRKHLLGQDAVYVGGGSVAGLMVLWRLHGLDAVFREAWEAGVVLFGVSAGSLCWHSGGTTDSFGPELRPWTDGLGLIPGSNCPHYDSEARRRPLYQRLVAEGALAPGYAADDDVGLHYVGTELHEAVSAREGASAYRVDADGESKVETRLLAVP